MRFSRLYLTFLLCNLSSQSVQATTRRKCHFENLTPQVKAPFVKLRTRCLDRCCQTDCTYAVTGKEQCDVYYSSDNTQPYRGLLLPTSKLYRHTTTSRFVCLENWVHLGNSCYRTIPMALGPYQTADAACRGTYGGNARLGSWHSHPLSKLSEIFNAGCPNEDHMFVGARKFGAAVVWSDGINFPDHHPYWMSGQPTGGSALEPYVWYSDFYAGFMDVGVAVQCRCVLCELV